MKTIFTILIALLHLSVFSQTQFMEVEGNYTGKNLFIQNPYLETSNEYCLQKLTVNQFVIDSGLNVSAFELRLDTLNFTTGDTIKLTFFHKEGCAPKILHENHHPVSTFDVKSISIDASGLLKWTTKNEEGKLTYTVQQYVWNKWIKIGEVDGKGNYNHNEYEFKILLHSGENKIRVMQDVSGKAKFSKPVSVTNPEIEQATIVKRNVSKELEFTREVRYEIYDSYGAIKKMGIGKIADVSDLKKGNYYINYDNNNSEEFIKK